MSGADNDSSSFQAYTRETYNENYASGLVLRFWPQGIDQNLSLFWGL